jgi:GT2 family glycosyltransferase
MDNYPLVTAFTLIYNTNPKHIIEAIESIRTNNYPNLQHIIIDDCSPNPKPKETVKQWIKENNYPCEFYEHEVNYGVCKTLNHVLELTKGKYLFGCSDDIILPHKLVTEVRILESLGPEYAATYSDAYLIDENSESLYGWFIQKHKHFDHLPDGYILEDLITGNFLPAMAMLWRTNLIREIGGYDEGLRFEDYDLHLRLFKNYKVKLIQQPTAKYRIHNNSLSNTTKDWSFDYFKIYKKHADMAQFSANVNNILRKLILSGTSLETLKKYDLKYPLLWYVIGSFIPFKKITNKVLIYLQNRGITL